MKSSLIKNQKWFIPSIIVSLASLLLVIKPATAHHPFGGQTPANFIEGFLSGLGHPIIGLDHFAFVVAAGLLGTRLKQGFLIPLAFVLATMIGTGIHLQDINLPFPELIIALSVLTFGVLLVIKKGLLLTSNFSTLIWATLALSAGIFHGYAYGEAIVGSEMTPLVSYLAGFALIQLMVSLGTFTLAKLLIKKDENKGLLIVRNIGFIISGIGLTFLSSAIVG
ncbi:MAG TPA: urease accessory protein UreJ [Cyanothece sp. UBA12306]|nr:urease accessory protein UreJ [Cyanothece sp. UBA12306]